MTVKGNANGYSGTLTHQFKVAKNISGTGTKDDPYLINTTDDWNLFAKSVEGGIDYYRKYVKLTNDITIQPWWAFVINKKSVCRKQAFCLTHTLLCCW